MKETDQNDKIIEKTGMVEHEAKKHYSKTLASAIAASIIVSGIMGAIAGFAVSETSNKEIHKIIEQQRSIETANDAGAGKVIKSNGAVSVIEEESAIINVVEKASPAVVSVIVTKDVPKLDSYFIDPFANDPFFNPFGFREVPREEPETEKREIGGGTGFIIGEDGFIITNRHVVEDEEAEYTVIINDGTKYNATVLARDSFMDLAIIKIESDEKFPVIKLGNSDSLKIGQTVVVIGNSLGEFRNTVSKGIISGLKRSISAGDGRGKSELLDEMIQTDAAINPGNSGGPIINLQGQAIGVNVAMAQGAENIGFAIPINEVKKIYQSVKDTGRIMRPYIGVRYILVNKQIQEENDLQFDYGALIIRGRRISDLAVVPGSPADKAGLVENDIILEIDGRKVTQDNDLSRIIKRKMVGDNVTMKVWSKGNEKMITVKLEEAGQNR
ncbi:MAG: trypsin-like peptidase domain-containing protein [Patescibacteria group bacterium]|nr:trypsin-like peptidase domain-containing protein [Patescibacteria group bacterium]